MCYLIMLHLVFVNSLLQEREIMLSMMLRLNRSLMPCNQVHSELGDNQSSLHSDSEAELTRAVSDNVVVVSVADTPIE